MRILMASAEGPPLQRAGALIDVMDALPREMRSRGHDVSVALPFYREIRANTAFEEKETGITVDIAVGDKSYVAEYFEGRSASGVQLFLIRGVEFFGRLNFLKGGILYADRITTVSEHYRREILTPAGGHALDGVLRENAYRLSAILHGADYARWNPVADRLLPANYGTRKLRGKQICRDALLEEMKLAPSPRGPVFGMVTRVVEEKGFEILVPLLNRLLWDDVRLLILGEGDPAYETALAIAARKFPSKFAYQKDYDEKLAHLIEAGMDISLIPSRFEPSGLSAMDNLKYGDLPVALATGGIQQIIEDYDPVTDEGYGFLCYDYSTEAFWDAIKRACGLFNDRKLWTKLMKRAMARHFSWDASAQRYEELYGELVHPKDVAA